VVGGSDRQLLRHITERPVRFLLFFEDSPPGGAVPRLWRWMTRPGFRHVWAGEPHGNVLIAINSAAYGTEFMLLGPQELTARAISRVLVVDGWTPARYYCRGILTCVTLVKSLLGIRAFWVQTPWGLYSYLTRRPRRGRLRAHEVKVDGSE